MSNNESAKRLVVNIEAKFIDGPKVHPGRVQAIQQQVAAAFQAAVLRELPGAEMNLSVNAEWGYLLFASSSSTSTATSEE